MWAWDICADTVRSRLVFYRRSAQRGARSMSSYAKVFYLTPFLCAISVRHLPKLSQ